MLVDFGKETFGKVIAENVKGNGKVKLYYGETRQEALAETLAETFDYIDVNNISLQMIQLIQGHSVLYTRLG